MEKYIIKTERLGFKKWSKEDYSKAEFLWGDTSVTNLIGGDLSQTQIEERLQKEIDNDSLFGVQYWPLYILESGDFIGCCGLRPYEDNTLEIGFHISSKYWRQGFAYEAAKKVIEYAFFELKISKLFSGHNPDNIGSKKLLEKLGFIYSHDEFYPPTGLNHPSYFLENNLIKEN